MVEEIKIPEGYKQTEVGVIPEDWDIDEIQNLAEITTGAKNTQDKIEGGEYPFFVRSQTIERINSFSFNGEAILTAGDGVGTGKVFHYINGKFDYHQRVYKISNFVDKLNGYFFYKYFSNNFYNRMMQMTAKSSVDSVRRDMVTEMLIPLPPTRTEQTAIATALSDMDGLIEGLEKLLVKKRNIKQGAMQDLLTPKDGWEVKTLLKLADNKKELFDDGDWIEAEHIADTGIRILQTGNIGIGSYIEKENKKYLKEKSFIKLKCKLLNVGDLLVCRLAEPAGRACVLPIIGEERIITSVDVTIFRPNPKKANSIFLANLFSTTDWFKKVTEKVGGTTHKRIARSSLGKIEIIIPNIIEQTSIANILSEMDTEITQLETQLSKYKMLKTGMMQELLTGKKRLV